jgi:hypothetical protein
MCLQKIFEVGLLQLFDQHNTIELNQIKFYTTTSNVPQFHNANAEPPFDTSSSSGFCDLKKKELPRPSAARTASRSTFDSPVRTLFTLSGPCLDGRS